MDFISMHKQNSKWKQKKTKQEGKNKHHNLISSTLKWINFSLFIFCVLLFAFTINNKVNLIYCANIFFFFYVVDGMEIVYNWMVINVYVNARVTMMRLVLLSRRVFITIHRAVHHAVRIVTMMMVKVQGRNKVFCLNVTYTFYACIYNLYIFIQKGWSGFVFIVALLDLDILVPWEYWAFTKLYDVQLSA